MMNILPYNETGRSAKTKVVNYLFGINFIGIGIKISFSFATMESLFLKDRFLGMGWHWYRREVAKVWLKIKTVRFHQFRYKEPRGSHAKFRINLNEWKHAAVV